MSTKKLPFAILKILSHSTCILFCSLLITKQAFPKHGGISCEGPHKKTAGLSRARVFYSYAMALPRRVKTVHKNSACRHMRIFCQFRCLGRNPTRCLWRTRSSALRACFLTTSQTEEEQSPLVRETTSSASSAWRLHRFCHGRKW